MCIFCVFFNLKQKVNLCPWSCLYGSVIVYNFMFQSVMTRPMVVAVLTTVAITVLITRHATNRRVNVTGDVIRDILIVTAAKVYLYIHWFITVFYISVENTKNNIEILQRTFNGTLINIFRNSGYTTVTVINVYWYKYIELRATQDVIKERNKRYAPHLVGYQCIWTCLFLLNSGCKAGFYGLNCSNLCSGHCENNDPCDHVSGLCPGGCQNGYIGARCNSCKKPAFFT